MQEIGCCGVFVCVSTAEQVRSKAECRLRLRATAGATTTLRAELREWLLGLGASADEALDLQLACSEVLTVVIRDAAAVVVDVDGELHGAVVTIVIREYGLCRDLDRIELDQEGTFSVALIQAVVDELDICWHPHGRTVVLNRQLQGSTRRPLRSPEVKGS